MAFYDSNSNPAQRNVTFILQWNPLNNKDVIYRKLQMALLHSSVRKRTKMRAKEVNGDYCRSTALQAKHKANIWQTFSALGGLRR